MKYSGTYKQLFEATKAHHLEISAYVIDIGCRDIETSNVRPFIEQDYRALLVEPNPTQVDNIIMEMEHYDFCTLEPVAITEENGITDFIASPNIGHSRIPNANFNRNKWQTKDQKEIKVTCWTFQKLLDEHSEFEDAGILDIDTEGYDTIVLKSLFKTKCRPMFIMVEDWSDPIIVEEQAELFKKHHYVMFSDRINQSKIYKKIL